LDDSFPILISALPVTDGIDYCVRRIDGRLVMYHWPSRLPPSDIDEWLAECQTNQILAELAMREVI